jgi:hypothetical protein
MNDKLTSSDIEKIELLTNEEIDELNFHELCLYYKMLDDMENVLKEEK